VTQKAIKTQREDEAEHQLSKDLDLLMDPSTAPGGLIASLRLLWARRRFLLRATFIGLVCATLIAFLIPKRYVSTTQLMPPDSQPSGTLSLISAVAGQSGSIGSLAGGLLGMKSTGDLFIGVLRSRTVKERIVSRFDLKKVYGVRLEEAARHRLEENTAIGEDRKSGIITVTVSDRDPSRAAAIAGAYVAELDSLITQLSTSSAHRERVFLEERLSAVTQDLESAEKNLSQFSSKSGAIDMTAQGKATVEAAAALEGQLIAAQSELQGLKQIYTDGNVRVRATQARITELRHQLEKLSGTADFPPKGEHTMTDELYPSLRQLPILGVPYADLYRRLKVQEVVFEALTKEDELAKVQEVKEVPSVKILDPSEIPESKSYPPRSLIMLLGTFLSAGLGMIWILAQDRWQAIAAEDPGKQFVEEIFHGVRARIPWGAFNGSRNGAGAGGALAESGKSDVGPAAVSLGHTRDGR
jgi:uncharacterized protein involved in exopolysaccharide biosynthesis